MWKFITLFTMLTVAVNAKPYKGEKMLFNKKIQDSISFYLQFDNGPVAEIAKGNPKGKFSSDHFPYKFYLQDGIRGKSLVVAGGNTIKFSTKDNIRKESGTICFWIRPLFAWDQKVGRIPFDMRYEEGAVTEFPDPSQRMGLTYNMIKGRTWRFFISVDRNYYLIGTKQRRDGKTNPRSRFYVGSGPQNFNMGDWMHIALAWDKDRAAVYINGVLEGKNVLNDGTLKNLPSHFQIGAKACWINANALSHMDEFYIFNRPLTEKEISNIYESYGKKSSVPTYKPKDKPNIIFMLDFTNGLKPSIHKGKGEICKTTISDKDIISDKERKSARIGNGKMISFNSKGNINPLKGSIFMRVKTEFDAINKGNIIFFSAKAPDNKEAPELLFDIKYPLSYRTFGAHLSHQIDKTKKINLEKSGQMIFSGTHRFDQGQWFDLVLTWDSCYANIYVNGIHEGQVKLNDGLLKSFPKNFSIGTENKKDSSLTALIDEFRIYDEPLNEKQVKQLTAPK